MPLPLAKNIIIKRQIIFRFAELAFPQIHFCRVHYHRLLVDRFSNSSKCSASAVQSLASVSYERMQSIDRTGTESETVGYLQNCFTTHHCHDRPLRP